MEKSFRPWDKSVLYQVYPWSFNEDEQRQPQLGNGSIKGMTEKLPYLVDMGVDAVWVSPPYQGPMRDAGYDISDFKSIHESLGTMEDFDEFVAECHANGVRVMLDFIPNHSSDQHEWFQKSVSRESGYEDYYVWHSGKTDECGNLIYGDDGRPLVPNNWGSVFSKPNKVKRLNGEMPWLNDDDLTPPVPAWKWNEERQQYYLHMFIDSQPDLNWKNENVAREMVDAMRFWIDKGVDGFRVDAFNHLAKDYSFPDEPLNPDYNESYDNPFDQLILQSSSNYMPMYRDVLLRFCDLAREYNARGREIKFIVESYVSSELLAEINAIAPDVATAFNFEAFREPWNASVRKEQLDRYYREIGADNIPNQVNGNHDNTRLATRLGNAARAAHVMNLLLPGLRVLYSGEELGLTDGHVPVERAQDLNGYRDGARTPVPWDNSASNAGFSDVPEQDLWLPVNEKDLDIAVNVQQGDSKSMLNLTKSAIRLCRLYDSLENGDYEPVRGSNDKNVLVYARAHEDNRMYVAVNFSDAWQMTKVGGARGRVVLSSDTVQDDLEARGRVDGVFHLAPNEQIAVVAE